MDWFTCLQAFDLIEKHQSFAEVARVLQVPNSVITKRIQWLEKEVHASLLIRTTRKVSLTETGDHLHKMIHPLLREWYTIQEQIVNFHAQPQGEITVCLPPNLSNIPIFLESFNYFLAQYPSMQLNITTTSEPIKLSYSKIDVLIATDKYVQDPNVTIGSKLFAFSYHCYAAPAFIEKHGEPKTPEELEHYNCLIFNNDHLWQFADKQYSVNGSLRTDSGSTLLSAGINGAGLIYVPDFFVEKELQNKQLKKLFTSLPSKEESLKIYYLKRSYQSRKVELFINLLRKKITNGL